MSDLTPRELPAVLARIENRPRSVVLTDQGLAAIGVSPTVPVPLLDLPWYRDRERSADG